MPTKKKETESVNDPGEKTEVVSDPDTDPGPQPDEKEDETGLPTEPDYTGPGTYAPRGERMDIPEGKVAFIGPEGAREISVQQWEQAGAKDMVSVRWDSGNKYMVDKEVFTEDALRIISQDQGFRIT